MIQTPIDVLVVTLAVATILGMITMTTYHKSLGRAIQHDFSSVIPVVLFAVVLVVFKFIAFLSGVSVD